MSIENLALQYNIFQKKYGRGLCENASQIIEELFSTKFTKIANGQILVSGKHNLKQQLDTVLSFAGAWTIEENLILPAKNNTQCTIRYVLQSEKSGDFDVIAIISSEDGEKIDTVDELYYQLS